MCALPWKSGLTNVCLAVEERPHKCVPCRGRAALQGRVKRAESMRASAPVVAFPKVNMLRHDYLPVNLKPETAPRVPHPKIALFAILGWDVPP